MWAWLRARLSEPSTFAALAAALFAAVQYVPEKWKGACVVVATFFCLLGVALPEKTTPEILDFEPSS